jgi:hypothetical protein
MYFPANKWRLTLVVAVASALIGAAPPAHALSPTAIESTVWPSSNSPLQDGPPPALARVSDSAEQLFNSASSSDWTAAAEQLMTLRMAEAELPVPTQTADLRGQLHTYVMAVADHVTARDQAHTMDDANLITRLAADLSSKYGLRVPFEVTMLAFFGRQLEVALITGNHALLERTIVDLRQAWNRVEPVILSRGLVDDARHFTDIVVTLEGARRDVDYDRAARAELDAAHKLARNFAAAPGPLRCSVRIEPSSPGSERGRHCFCHRSLDQQSPC